MTIMITTQVGHDSATQFSLGTFNHAGLQKLTQALLDDLQGYKRATW